MSRNLAEYVTLLRAAKPGYCRCWCKRCQGHNTRIRAPSTRDKHHNEHGFDLEYLSHEERFQRTLYDVDKDLVAAYIADQAQQTAGDLDIDSCSDDANALTDQQDLSDPADQLGSDFAAIEEDQYNGSTSAAADMQEVEEDLQSCSLSTAYSADSLPLSNADILHEHQAEQRLQQHLLEQQQAQAQHANRPSSHEHDQDEDMSGCATARASGKADKDMQTLSSKAVGYVARWSFTASS